MIESQSPQIGSYLRLKSFEAFLLTLRKVSIPSNRVLPSVGCGRKRLDQGGPQGLNPLKSGPTFGSICVFLPIRNHSQCLNPLKSGPTFGSKLAEKIQGQLQVSQSPQIGSYLRLSVVELPDKTVSKVSIPSNRVLPSVGYAP